MGNEIRGTEPLESELLDIFAEQAMIDRETLSLSDQLVDLDIESADYVMILMAIEEKYDLYLSVDGELTEAKTVKDLLTFIMTKLDEKEMEKSNPAANG